MFIFNFSFTQTECLKQLDEAEKEQNRDDAESESSCRIATVFVVAKADLDSLRLQLRVGVLPARVFDRFSVVRERSLAAIPRDVDRRLLGIVNDVFDASLASRQFAKSPEIFDVR